MYYPHIFIKNFLSDHLLMVGISSVSVYFTSVYNQRSHNSTGTKTHNKPTINYTSFSTILKFPHHSYTTFSHITPTQHHSNTISPQHTHTLFSTTHSPPKQMLSHHTFLPLPNHTSITPHQSMN